MRAKGRRDAADVDALGSCWERTPTRSICRADREGKGIWILVSLRDMMIDGGSGEKRTWTERVE